MSTTSGRCAGGQAHRLVAVGRLADDLDVVLRRRAAPGSRPAPAPGRRRATTRITGSPARPAGRRGRDPEAAAGAGAGLERAAERRGPLPHADEAVARRRGRPAPVAGAARRRRRPATTSVVVAVRARRTVGRGRAGVAGDVGERLLHDAVGARSTPAAAAGRRRVDVELARRARAARACVDERRRGASEAGASGSSGGGARRRWRSTSSTERSSPSASLLACLMAVSAVRACSGCSSMRCRATPACTLMSEMLWASTSCSSRAMRSRSSLAWRRLLLGRVWNASHAPGRGGSARTPPPPAPAAATTPMPAAARHGLVAGGRPATASTK